ncbi:MAG: tol-pal system YbgF family protein [Sandaracinaceae bacterium]
MARPPRCLPLLAAVALSAGPVTAQGQEDDAPATEERARALFEAGTAAYAEGRFPEALASFEAAYDLTHEPDLLYNKAAVLDRLRRDEEALAAYEEYRRLRPDSPDRNHIEARIAALRSAIDRRAEPAETDPGDGGEGPDDAGEVEEEPGPDPVDGTSGGPGPWPAILIGSGATLLAAGTGLLIWWAVDANAIRSADDHGQIRGAYRRAVPLSASGWALLGAGAGLLAVGIAWAIAGASRASPAEARIELVPGMARLDLVGSF